MSNIRTYGAILVSALALIAFLVALAVAYLSHDQNNLSLLIGAVITFASTVVSYWLGSSSGSQKKDEALTRMAEEAPLSKS